MGKGRRTSVILWRLFKGRTTHRRLSVDEAFREEIARNLEFVQVMEQRRIISRKMDIAGPVPPGFQCYEQAMRAFNEAFEEYQKSRKEYAADSDRQTRARALVLDSQYDNMMKKFNALKPQILAAQMLPAHPVEER